MENVTLESFDVNAIPGDPILTVGWFSSETATFSTSLTLTWKQLARKLSVPLSHHGLCFILAKLTDGRALKTSVECTFAVGLDYDKGSPNFDDACTFWGNHDAIAYTTRRHTEEAPRFRIILRASRAMLPEEHVIVWKHVAKLAATAGHVLDLGTFSPERKWYAPAQHKNGDAPAFETWSGMPLDVDKIVAQTTNGHKNGTKNSSSSSSSAAADLSRIYALADIIRKTPKGLRNYAWNKDVFTLAGLFAAGRLDPSLSEDMILDVLFDAMRANSENPDREVKKLQKSWEDGKQKPLEDRQQGRTAGRPASDPADGEPIEWTHQLARNDKGNIVKSTENYRIIFENADFTKKLYFDEFYDSLFVQETNQPRQFSEHSDGFAFNVWLSQRGLPELPGDSGMGMLLGYAQLSKRQNALQRHLQALKWDGVPRLDTWLVRYLGAADTPYTRQVGRLWLISAMARAFKPGCQVDYALILEGPQGIGKSTALRILGGPFYSGNLSPIGTKDAYQEIQRVWIQELSELESFNRSQLEAIKNFITGTNDIFRPSYGRFAKDHLRHLIFAGTSNDFEYLRDQTGNRRFWPMRVTQLDVGALEQDRDALLAEALLAFVSGAAWWPDTTLTSLATAEQDIRRSRHPWEDTIARYVFSRNEVTTDDLRQSLCIEISKWGMQDQKLCGTILRTLGWERIRKRVANVLVWVYMRPSV